MPEEKRRQGLPDHLTKANAEGNKVFAKLGAEIDKHIKEGADEIDVLKISQAVGIQLTQEDLSEMRIDRFILPIPFLPWYYWYPIRPIYCWWWNRFYPYYRWCCPYWWHSCHWWR